MRTLPWILTPALVLGLAACGDDGNETDSSTGTTTTTTTTTGMMTSSTTEMGTSTSGTTAEPTTEGPTSTSTTADPSSSGGSTTTGGGNVTCDAYCALYETGCVDFNEYDNTEACLAQCAQWPVGTEGATDGDSLACRLYHVGVANMADANVHCPHASPNGGGVCVDPAAPTCDAYCTAYLKNCTGDQNAYADMADCMDQCSHWYPGTMADTGGDTVGCRLYHGGAPAMSDPVTHCPHAGPGGGGVCVAA